MEGEEVDSQFLPPPSRAHTSRKNSGGLNVLVLPIRFSAGGVRVTPNPFKSTEPTL
jgi:hypothetical protein